jgi:hypothetical protein
MSSSREIEMSQLMRCLWFGLDGRILHDVPVMILETLNDRMIVARVYLYEREHQLKNGCLLSVESTIQTFTTSSIKSLLLHGFGSVLSVIFPGFMELFTLIIHK